VHALWRYRDLVVERQQGRFALFLPVFLAAGVVAYFAWPGEPAIAAPAGMAASLAAAAWRWPHARPGLLCFGLFAAGFALARGQALLAPPFAPLPATGVSVAGVVAQIEALPEGRRVTVAAPSLDGETGLPRALRIRLRTSDDTALAPGDFITIRALVRPPPPPSYPGGWDMQREAYFSGLGGFGFALRAAAVREEATSHLAAVRATVAQTVLQTLPGARGAIAATLLTGMGAAIPPADRVAFQNSGLAHLLAVAGLHIGIVMGVVFAAARRLLCCSERLTLRWRVKSIAALAALAAGFGYMLLTGAHVPIMRSFGMACLVTLAILTGRRALSMRGLALAALAIMAMAPAEVMGVSFQMSFAVVMVLLAGWEMLRPGLASFGAGRWWRRPVLYAVGLAGTSAMAGTAALPFALYHFGNATIYYVPANLVAVPVMAFWVLPLGMAALVLMPAGLGWLALIPMGWGIEVLLAVARFVAAWPGAALPFAQPPAYALLLVAAGMILACLWRGWLRLSGVPCLVVGCVCMLIAPRPAAVLAPDGSVVAARLGSAVIADVAPRASAFDKEIPLHVWGMPAVQAEAAMNCTKSACASADGAIWIMRDADAACPGAAVAVSRLMLTGDCHPPVVLDRAAARAGGALALWRDGNGWQVQSDLALRGDRPWVIRPGPLLPPARTE
jgi:competence protein ComEC